LRIDVLVNNAGFGRLDWLENLDPIKDIQSQFDVNVLGVIQTTRQALPVMIKQRSGHIINMCSMAGLVATPTYTVYAACKHAVHGFSEAYAGSQAMGIDVSLTAPAVFYRIQHAASNANESHHAEVHVVNPDGSARQCAV
jgi:short-subunit dehydrogenase